jgi:hypothetical protein
MLSVYNPPRYIRQRPDIFAHVFTLASCWSFSWLHGNCGKMSIRMSWPEWDYLPAQDDCLQTFFTSR